jgi:predicted N-formylglutamate amidohydrolase
VSTALPDARVTQLNPEGTSCFVLLCEHASNYIPDSYHGLGLPPAELQRHIAWDIGAAALAARLVALLDATTILAGHSRLLIDCNRPLGAPSSIPPRSEATDIPGNLGLDAAEIAYRTAAFFVPFRDRVSAVLDARAAAGRRTLVLGIHSFTPVYLGVARPWQTGVLYREARAFGQTLLAALRAEPGLEVGDNEPYRVTLETDHTVPVHGDGRGLEAALIEVRQDLLGDAAGIEAWAQRLARVLRLVEADLP